MFSARWLRLPALVSYIAAGLLIGPVLGLVGPGTTDPGALDLLGEMGGRRHISSPTRSKPASTHAGGSSSSAMGSEVLPIVPE